MLGIPALLKQALPKDIGTRSKGVMDMTTRINTAIVLLILVVALLWVSGGSAQQDGVGSQGIAANLAVRQDDSDAYWLDTNAWLEYGYRPHAVTPPTRFASTMPSYFAGSSSGYSFGTVTPAECPLGRRVARQVSDDEIWHVELMQLVLIAVTMERRTCRWNVHPNAGIGVNG